MGDGAAQCQAAMKALGQIAAQLQQAHALRAQMGPDLFTSSGGAWTGPDAQNYKATLANLLETEQRMLGQLHDMLDELQGVYAQLETLDV